jgi:hypothetical protein
MPEADFKPTISTTSDQDLASDHTATGSGMNVIYIAY